MTTDATNTNNKGHQSINGWNIYTRKAKAALNSAHKFAKGSMGIRDDGRVEGACLPAVLPAVGLRYTALLFTMTIVAGVKTAVDLSGRTPLFLSDITLMNEVLQKLEEVKDNRIDEIATAIINARGHNKLERQLAAVDWKKRIAEFQLVDNAIKQMKDSMINEEQKVLTEFINNNNIAFFKPALQTSAQFQLSDDQKIEIRNLISTQKSELVDMAKSEKVKLIMDYLNAPHNAGKKLQHDILDILQPMIEDRESLSKSDTLQII